MVSSVERTAKKQKTRNGAVKWYNPQKQFGYVTEDGTSEEFFFTTNTRFKHNLSSDWKDGQSVSFYVITVRDGRKAAVKMMSRGS